MTLRIIVLIKQVPDPKGYVGIKEDGTLDREKANSIINPYDKNALEAALTIKEKSNGKITVVSMGPPKAKDVLREALAMGADKAVLLSDKKLSGSDTLATSHALTCAIKKVGCYDLILCGMEASDGNTGQVGPGVAEGLGVPQITYVDNLEIGGEYVEARRMLEGGYEIVRAKLPVLLTITNTANEPRGTTFAGILKSTKMSLTRLSVEDIGADECKIGLSGSPTKIRKIEKTVSQRGRYVVEGETLDEVIDNFLKRLREDDVNLGNSNERRT